MSNVRYHCDACNLTIFAPPNTEPACRKNLGPKCTMVQTEEFPAVVAKKVTSEKPSKSS